MANTWGSRITLSIFGESHGSAVGVIIDGLPPGTRIDPDLAVREMRRRAPGHPEFSTARNETDKVEILSGLKDGKTTGSPLCGVICNHDARSRDYDSKLRPGHADMTALLKYSGHADMRGGGHFSGRLTAPLLFAGALAKQILAERGIEIYGRIAAIAGIPDGDIPCLPEAYREASESPFPAYHEASAATMRDAIRRAKEEGDSVGGIVEAVAFHVPAGLGEPFFESVESRVAAMLFSIPAVKGVEFGEGFPVAAMRAGEANDPILVQNGVLSTATNHSGGILGGITNGMPVVVRAAFKPTPSIAKEQETVDAATMQPATLQIRGRHDPCIVPRAVPVVEAALALCILDLSLEKR